MTFLPPEINLPICFSRKDLKAELGKNIRALDGCIGRALKRSEIIQLKNGLYMASTIYLHEPDKIKIAEYIASQLCQPSYISLEYVLEIHQMLPLRSLRSVTSITSKTSRTFENFSGKYSYTNIKPSVYAGFEEVAFQNSRSYRHTYHMATKAKALFDYLYLNSKFGRRNEKYLHHQLFQDSAFQWEHFSEEDLKEFDGHVWKSNSYKMMRILRAINGYFEKKKFDIWAEELLR